MKPTLVATHTTGQRSSRACRSVYLLATLAGLVGVWCQKAQGAGSLLTVTNGSGGGGGYPAGAVVHVWADAPASNQVWGGWSGDIGALADPNAWHTTLTMPAAPVRITATLRDWPAWTPTDYILNGRPSGDPNAVHLIYYFPPSPLGVIFRFHGATGRADTAFQKVEDFTFMRDAVAKGFAVAALDSTDRVNKLWDSDATANNMDVKNVQLAIGYFIGRGLMTASTPKFSLGMSDGGSFAPKAAYYLGFQANANFCSAGAPDQLMTTTTVPNMWCLAQNDPHPSFFAKVAVFQPSFTSRGVAWACWVNEPSPVYAKRFARIPGLSALDSDLIYRALKKGGVLDANDYLLASPETSNAWTSALPAVYSLFKDAILDQLDCCYSEHKFYSDRDDAVLAFFRTNSNASPVVPAPAATSNEQTRYAEAASYSAAVEGDALLVMKQGQIVFENYVGSTSASTAHMLASGTKSFNVALFALGQADGIWTLDEKVAQTITEWQGDPNKSQIRIRHLLSLTSGLVDSPQYSDLNVPNLDTYDLAINGSSAPYAPGVACIYAPCNFYVFAALFERKTGLDPVQYLYDRLLSKLGFSTTNLKLWIRDKKGKPDMPGGAHFTAREWVNYGKLWIQNGQWDGQQLLDPAVVQLAVTYPNPAFRGYGLTWWLNVSTAGTYDPGVDQIPPGARGDVTQIATNAPTDLYMAAGLENQRLYVIPSQQLVIVRYAHGLGLLFSDHALLGKILGVP